MKWWALVKYEPTKSGHAYFTVIKKIYIFLHSLPLSVPFSWQKCPFSSCFFFFFIFLFIAFPLPFFIPAFLPHIYFLTQTNIITQFPLSYAITYSVLYTWPETWDSNQKVWLIIIILLSFSMLTLMSMVSICNITVICFLTSNLDDNQFTSEGKAKLRKAREERDPHCVKLNLSLY